MPVQQQSLIDHYMNIKRLQIGSWYGECVTDKRDIKRGANIEHGWFILTFILWKNGPFETGSQRHAEQTKADIRADFQ